MTYVSPFSRPSVHYIDSTVPDMSEVHPSNVTEFRGGRAKFHCWVRSTSRPEVQWLKRLPGVVGGGPVVRNDLNLYSNTSLVVGQDHYQSILYDGYVLYTPLIFSFFFLFCLFLMCLKRFKVIRVHSTLCTYMHALLDSMTQSDLGCYNNITSFLLLHYSLLIFPICLPWPYMQL